MSPEQLTRLLAQSDQTRSDLDVLDEQEMEVFSILGQGYSSSQVEREFGMAPAQFRSLKDRIQKKLGLKSELALLRRANQRDVSS